MCKKFIFILLPLLLLIFLFSPFSSAFYYGGVNVSSAEELVDSFFPGKDINFVIFTNDDDDIVLLFTAGETYYNYVNVNNIVYSDVNKKLWIINEGYSHSALCAMYISYYDTSTHSFTTASQIDYKASCLKVSSAEQIIYSTCDIYLHIASINNIDSSEPFLLAPGLGRILVPTVETAKEIPGLMTKVLMIILPIGLILFGMLLLVLLIRLVISRVS